MAMRTAVFLIVSATLVGGCGAEQMQKLNALFIAPADDDFVAARESDDNSEPSESYILAYLESATKSKVSLAQIPNVKENRDVIGEGDAQGSDLIKVSDPFDAERTLDTRSATPPLYSQKISSPERNAENHVAKVELFGLPDFGASYSKSFSGRGGSKEISALHSNSIRLLPPMSNEASNWTPDGYVDSVFPLFRANETNDETAVPNSEFSQKAATVSGMDSPPLESRPATRLANFASGFFERIFRRKPSNKRNISANISSAKELRRKNSKVAKAQKNAYTLSLEPLQPPNRFQQMECLVSALYFEARGESKKGQLAVAEVIMNRVNSRKFPNSICSVVTQGNGEKHRCQFSYLCDGLPEAIYELKAYERAWRIGAQFLASSDGSLTNGATHFHTIDVRPSWSSELEKTAQIGRHVFFRESL